MTNYDHLEKRVTQQLLDQQGEINDLRAKLDRIRHAVMNQSSLNPVDEVVLAILNDETSTQEPS